MDKALAFLFTILAKWGGAETVNLLESEIPSHSHALMATGEDGVQGTLTSGITLAKSVGGAIYQTTTNANLVGMNSNSLAPSGGDQPHNNMMPYLTFNFCIAMQGVYPPRT